MKFFRMIFLLPALPVIIFTAGCAGNSNDNSRVEIPLTKTESSVSEPVTVGTETGMLLKDLAENGDYVNSREFPSLIKASAVNELIGTNILVVDIRSTGEYSAGHIKGAVKKDFGELPAFFESAIRPFEYDRIIIVSSDGQAASYTTSLLRLMGYGNVYAMRWGMSAWNSTYATSGWFAGCSAEYQERIETTVNEAWAGRKLPELTTGMATGEEIGIARFTSLFSEGLDNVMITPEDLFSDPSKYYIINYDRRDKYESGHIPGAVRYKPGATLGFIDEMGSIPGDRTVVVYCGTGHNSGFVTAYLRLFGYDARTLKYGNNGFMYDRMVTEKETLSWLPFTPADVNDFEVVK